MDLSDPDAAARMLIETLGQNGAMLAVEDGIEERNRRIDADGVALWKAVADWVREIGQEKLSVSVHEHVESPESDVIR